VRDDHLALEVARREPELVAGDDREHLPPRRHRAAVLDDGDRGRLDAELA
jgi:hypothetical protein